MSQAPNDETGGDLATLRAAYEEIAAENKRLRDARASVTRQLGPLPISAAVIAGLVSVFPGNSSQSGWHLALIVLALALFALMVVISIAFSGLAPYRELRAAVEGEARPERPPQKDAPTDRPINPSEVVDSVIARVQGAQSDGEPASVEAQWLAAMIDVERQVRDRNGTARASSAERIRPTDLRRPVCVVRKLFVPGPVQSLQEGFNRERRGLYVVQGLFALMVVLLIVARLT
ncbi:MAG TPA: hypothetical protein VHT25_06700 [Solirubrobacteraceae bacterium]|nr:hypothetical protein [Solirubrobacteraceae bacterium]